MAHLRQILIFLLLVTSGASYAQFVFPKPEYHRQDGVYIEDPYTVEYREKFFAVFRGDFKTFEEAYQDIRSQVEANPQDAKATVWLGNGKTVKAALLLTQGKKDEIRTLLQESRELIDRAVELAPDDPNVYMMRAVTLYIQGQYWPANEIPRANWEKLRDDCLKFIEFVGPERMRKASIHLRGETYGELGIAYARLGESEKAIEAFEKVIELAPDTDYETRARKEIEKLRMSEKNS